MNKQTKMNTDEIIKLGCIKCAVCRIKDGMAAHFVSYSMNTFFF